MRLGSRNRFHVSTDSQEAVCPGILWANFFISRFSIDLGLERNERKDLRLKGDTGADRHTFVLSQSRKNDPHPIPFPSVGSPHTTLHVFLYSKLSLVIKSFLSL